MANPNRDQAIDNLITTLQGINGAPPYTLTVGRVEHRLRAPSKMSADYFPWIGVYEGASEYDAIPQFYKTHMEIELYLGVLSDTEASARQRLYDLMDDVIHAIHVDPRRGGFAYETRVLRDEPIEGFDNSVGMMILTIQIRYVRGFVAGPYP